MEIKKLYPVIFGLYVLCITVLSPTTLFAAYTWNGQSFSTFNEMLVYIQEYMQVWREIHGLVNEDASGSTHDASTSLEVTTSSAEGIDHDRARLTARFDLNEEHDAEVWFEYGTRSNIEIFRTESEVVDRSFGSRVFDREVRGLTHDTVYYFRAVAKDENGVVVRGDVEKFRTAVDVNNNDAEVKARTNSASPVKDDWATLRGQITFKDTAHAYVWFEYGEDAQSLDHKSSKMLVSIEDGKSQNFERTLRNLREKQTYYFRLVGQDLNGVRSYGATYRFTTPRDIIDERPEIRIHSVKDVGLYSATLSGTVYMNDFRDGVVFFVYGESYEDVREIASMYDRYSRIKDRGDDLQKVKVDDELDREGTYTLPIDYLDLYTRYYYALGVEYEYQGDETLKMSSISSFTTKDLR